MTYTIVICYPCLITRQQRAQSGSIWSMVVTLLLDSLARLQRLPLTLQTPRLRISPTDKLNQVVLHQDLSV